MIRRSAPPEEARRELGEVAGRVRGLVEERAAPLPEVVDVKLGGSYAKGTWIAESADIDVFVRFREDTPEERFRELGERVGFEALREFGPYRRYSEHPYVEARVGGTLVNVVPCYKVRPGAWKSSADRSQFHTEFMCANLDEGGRGEVRVLKTFLRANGIYGADASRRGFSGYAAEVLVWNLGSFRGVLEAFAGIRDGMVVGKAARGFDTAVTIMDPIDENRNLAAAISDENIARLTLIARAFLRRPSVRFFEAGRPGAAGRVLEHLVAVEFGYGGESPDAVWGQINKASASLAAQLEMRGFKVIRNSASSDGRGRAALMFLLESTTISKRRVREGPEIFNEAHAASFVAKNLERSQLMWVDGRKRILSLEEREFSDAGELLRDLLGTKLDRSGIPKGLVPGFRRGFKVSSAGEAARGPVWERVSEFATTDEKAFSSD